MLAMSEGPGSTQAARSNVSPQSHDVSIFDRITRVQDIAPFYLPAFMVDGLVRAKVM